MKLFSLPVAIVLITLMFSSCIEPNTDFGIAFEEQLKADTTTIGAFLRTNNVNALVDVSGVRFVIDSVTTGFPPKNTSTVKFKYVGRFLTGSTFDQGTATGEISNFIDGFQIGLSLIPEGGKGRFYIPSGYAYGTSGTGSIPPNSNIMFEVELLDIVETQIEKERLAADTVTIDNYLAQNSIDAIKDKTGIRYVITEQGSGGMPSLYSRVSINYTGKLLSNGTTFFTGSGQPSGQFDSRVINYMYGIQAILPKLSVGSKATVYIPSGLGYGDRTITAGVIAVPANSNLIYEIELLGVSNN
jgi:FKBP-type peptidyl-prolyl cis-trans isomerase